MNYRHPTERPTLLLTLAIAAIVVVFVTPFTAGVAVALVLFGVGWQFLAIRARVQRIRSGAAPVERFPRVRRIVDRCRARLRMREAVDVFVEDRPVLNAFAIGLGQPYVVVVYTGLIDALDDDELAAVVGHELGHVMFRHTRLLGLIGQAGTQGYGAGIVEVLLRQFVFLFWRRATEFTADRAGLVACGSLEKALSTELKLGLGARWRTVDIPALIRHYREHDVGLGEQVGSLLATHPDMHARIDRIVDFYHSDLYRRVSSTRAPAEG